MNMNTLLNKPYVNEVTLTGQNPPLKCCKCLEFLAHFLNGLDLSIEEIWGLKIKGLQICLPSNSDNDSAPVQLKQGPSGSTRAGARSGGRFF